jgi:hypothetical protein
MRTHTYSNEIWKPIPEFEIYYDISNYGRVRSWHSVRHSKTTFNKEPTILKPCVNTKGYLKVSLEHKSFLIHRLVLITFKGNKFGMEASHLDNDRKNNRLSNLCWETHKENEDRKRIFGTRVHGEKHGHHRFTEEDILNIRKMRIEGKTLGEIAKIYPTTRSYIQQICNRRTWRYL